jgi:hypothetical protein
MLVTYLATWDWLHSPLRPPSPKTSRLSDPSFLARCSSQGSAAAARTAKTVQRRPSPWPSRRTWSKNESHGREAERPSLCAPAGSICGGAALPLLLPCGIGIWRRQLGFWLASEQLEVTADPRVGDGVCSNAYAVVVPFAQTLVAGVPTHGVEPSPSCPSSKP